MMKTSTLWAVKYRPVNLSEFVDNKEALVTLENWLASWKTLGSRPTKRTVFLYGPPGVGKSEAVVLLAGKYGFDLIEMNASDERTRDSLQRVAGAASTEASLYGRMRIILLDELEGMSGTEDRGGLSIIASLAATTRSPLVLIGTDMWDRRFTSFRKSSLFIEFKAVPTRSMIPRMKEICRKEGIQVEEEAIRTIAERARGDLRSAVTDLQALAQGKTRLTYQEANWLEGRDRHEPVFDTLKNIFNARTCQEARMAVNVSDVDYEMLFEWIYENIPHQITDQEDMAAALDALSKADIFLSRIRREQEWRLLPYAIEDMSAGVCMARTHPRSGWTPFKFPQRIMAMSRTRAMRELRNSIGAKIGRATHTSVETALTSTVPYLRVIFRADKKQAAEMAKTFGLDPEEATFMSK